jgi:hypothetical protein
MGYGGNAQRESRPPDLNAFWDAAAAIFPPGGQDKIKPSCLRIHRSLQIGPCRDPKHLRRNCAKDSIYLKCLELLFVISNLLNRNRIRGVWQAKAAIRQSYFRFQQAICRPRAETSESRAPEPETPALS